MSWWGSDGSVCTTRSVRVLDNRGTYETSSGHMVGEVEVCEADHDVHGCSSHWTVELLTRASTDACHATAAAGFGGRAPAAGAQPPLPRRMPAHDAGPSCEPR